MRGIKQSISSLTKRASVQTLIARHHNIERLGLYVIQIYKHKSGWVAKIQSRSQKFPMKPALARLLFYCPCL
jgi:hypothetical protein